MEKPKSDTNNNANNIIIILHIDYDIDNRISININRMPISCRTIVPCSSISFNRVNIKSDILIIKQSQYFSRL